MALTASRNRALNPWMGLGIVLLIAFVGLFFIKWDPYYHRAFAAAENGSIGQSILMGTSDSPPEPSWAAAWQYALAYGRAIWQAMVLGLLLGSAVQALVPARWVARALGGAGFGSVGVGGLMSLPTMMCTCCAAPVVAGLRRQRASAGGAMAFWLGNAVLNPATLIFIGFVLGWHWAGLRLALGVAMVFGVGYVINRMAAPARVAAERAELAESFKQATPEEDRPYLAQAFKRWLSILARMTVRLVPEYLVLVLLLGAARAWLFPHVGADIGNGWLWIVAFAVAGMLFVIPTAGEVPIIQAMLALGVGAGPAGALLMTLPPISLPSLAMLMRSFSRTELATVIAAVVGFGVLAGVLAMGLGF